MERDKFEIKPGKDPSNVLQDFLSAYRPSAGQPGPIMPPDTGLSYWEAAREAARGRSARDWRAEWKRMRRDPVRQGRDWKLAALAFGVVLTLLLSVYGLVRLDSFLDSHHWHWMNQHESTEPADHIAPTIHWGGQ